MVIELAPLDEGLDISADADRIKAGDIAQLHERVSSDVAAAAAGALVDDGQKVLLGTLQIADGLEGRGGEVRRRHVTIIRPALVALARAHTGMRDLGPVRPRTASARMTV